MKAIDFQIEKTEISDSASEKNADRIVDCLRSAVADGAAGLADVPALVARVIREELWRVRATKLDAEPRTFATFAEFVSAAPPAGLGTDLKTLWRLCDDAPNVLDLLITQTPGRRRGGDRRSREFRTKKTANEFIAAIQNQDDEVDQNLNFKSDIVTFETDRSPTDESPEKFARGNSRQYALRRLRVARPDLSAAVLRGETSAHRAMIAAGLRRPRLTVGTDDPAEVAAVLTQHFAAPALRQIIESLTAFLHAEQNPTEDKRA